MVLTSTPAWSHLAFLHVDLWRPEVRENLEDSSDDSMTSEKIDRGKTPLPKWSLPSDYPDHFTGASIFVDGGMTLPGLGNWWLVED